MRSVVNPNNVRERMTITGPVAMYGLAGMHIKHLRVIMDKRDPEQRHLLQDAKCDGLVIDKLEIIGKPDGSSKEAWIATDCKGVVVNSPSVLIKHYYAEYVHMPLQLIGENSQCNAMEAFNVTGDAFQLCGNGTRLESAVVKGLLKIRKYKVEHIDVGMMFYKARKGFEAAARVLKNAYIGNVTLLKSGHPFEDPMPQGIVCPDDSYENCLVENCDLPGVNPEHGVRFGHAINCIIRNIKTNGAVAFGDRKPTRRIGTGNRIINCDSPTCVFEDNSGVTENHKHKHPPLTREDKVMKQQINRKMFFDEVRGLVFGGSMNADQVAGCEAMLDYWERHHPNANKEWIAYSLATAYHESGHTMQPIKERGGTAYFTQLYDVRGTKPERARKHGNVNPGDGAKYCGRGLTQITWHCNYDKQGKKHGIDLVNNPDLLLQMHISDAAKIMISAMIDGDFCWVKRGSGYVPASLDMFTADDGSFNAVDARRMINGTDKAHLIAGYHKSFMQGIVNGTPIHTGYDLGSGPDESMYIERDEAGSWRESEHETLQLNTKPDVTIPHDADLGSLVSQFLAQNPDVLKHHVDEQLQHLVPQKSATNREPVYLDEPWTADDWPAAEKVVPRSDIPESHVASKPAQTQAVPSKANYKSKTLWTSGVTAAGYIATKMIGDKLGIPTEVLPYVESTIVVGGLSAIGIIRKFFTNTVLRG